MNYNSNYFVHMNHQHVYKNSIDMKSLKRIETTQIQPSETNFHKNLNSF